MSITKWRPRGVYAYNAVPLALFTGVTAWRGSAVGYLLCATVVVKALAMAAAICAMLLSAWAFEGKLELVPLVIFAMAAGVSVWLSIRMYRSVLPAPSNGSMRENHIN